MAPAVVGSSPTAYPTFNKTNMAYFLHTKLPLKASVNKGLEHIYGIGAKSATNLCKVLGLQKDIKVQNLRRFHLSKIQKNLESVDRPLSTTLRRLEKDNIKELVKLGTYRGRRHSANLPVRGQRTHTNARTQKRWKKK